MTLYRCGRKTWRLPIERDLKIIRVICRTLYMHSTSPSKDILYVLYENSVNQNLEHRSCIPDLAPSAFHLFPALSQNHADHNIQAIVRWKVVSGGLPWSSDRDWHQTQKSVPLYDKYQFWQQIFGQVVGYTYSYVIIIIIIYWNWVFTWWQ
jgi:hypothetical protein